MDKMETQIEKLWNKDFVLTTLAGFFGAMVFYMTMTTMAAYSMATYAVDASMAGMTASVFVLGSVAGRLFSGAMLDIIGRRKMVFVSAALFFVASLGYQLPCGIVFLICLRFVHGVMFGVAHTSLSTIVVGFIPKGRYGEGIGYFTMNFILSTAIGPFVGMIVSRYLSYTALFAVVEACSLMTLILVFMIRIEPPQIENPRPSSSLPGNAAEKRVAKNILEKAALPLACVVVTLSICFAGVSAFVGSYAETIGSADAAPFYFMVYGITVFAFRPLVGKMLDRYGDNIVMMPSIAFYAASLAALALAGQQFVLLLAAFIMGLGYSNAVNMGQAIAVRQAPPHRIAAATSTVLVAIDSGQGIGPIIMGFIKTHSDFHTMYFVEFIVVALCVPLYFLLHGRRSRRG